MNRMFQKKGRAIAGIYSSKLELGILAFLKAGKIQQEGFFARGVSQPKFFIKGEVNTTRFFTEKPNSRITRVFVLYHLWRLYHPVKLKQSRDEQS